MATYPPGATLDIAVGANSNIDCGQQRTLTIKIDDRLAGAAWIRCGLNETTEPTAPVATPAPADGAVSSDGWQYIGGKGSSYSPPPLEFGYYRWVQVWGITDGGLSWQP